MAKAYSSGFNEDQESLQQNQALNTVHGNGVHQQRKATPLGVARQAVWPDEALNWLRRRVPAMYCCCLKGSMHRGLKLGSVQKDTQR